MAYHIPQEELLDRQGLAQLQRRKLTAMFEVVLASNPFFRKKYGKLSPTDAVARFCELPFTTRAELQDDQTTYPPYGSNLSYPIDAYCRLHQTSGSRGSALRVLDRTVDWNWWRRCWGIIYRGAGVRREDRLVFPFSFGPFIGFWAAFESAVELGNLCLPAGGMTTAARLQYLMENSATVVCCTPTYALRMAEVAAERGIDLAGSAVRRLIVAGEPGGSIPSTRAAIEKAFGARVIDHAGMSEVGPHGFECEESPGGVHLIESEFVCEVIDPSSGAAVGDGAEGELVVTNLGRWGMPMIRYRTGDLVRLSHERCVCGRSYARAGGGILGRVDDLVFIRGNNVYPAVIEDVVRGVGGVAEFQMRVGQRGAMSELTVELEPSAGTDSNVLAEQVTSAIQDRLHFRPMVRCVERGTLPRSEMKSRRLVRDDQE